MLIHPKDSIPASIVPTEPHNGKQIGSLVNRIAFFVRMELGYRRIAYAIRIIRHAMAKKTGLRCHEMWQLGFGLRAPRGSLQDAA